MHLRYILSAAILSLMLYACTGQAGQRGEGTSVATTIAPVAGVIQEILGEDARILVLLPQGATPETYEPTAQDLMSLSSCKAYVCMGDLGFERQWLSRVSELMPELTIVNVGDSLLMHEAHAHDHDDAGHCHAEGEGYAHDPHYWTSIRGLRAIAEATLSMARQHELAHPDTLLHRGGALMSRIDALELEVSQALERGPSRAFVIYHPSLTDFADEHGLRQLVIEQDGKEPSPAQLAQLIEEARQQGVRVVFTQKEFGTRLCESVATEIGARIVEIDPLASDWQAQIRAVVDALAQ